MDANGLGESKGFVDAKIRGTRGLGRWMGGSVSGACGPR